ncbi:MAG: reverse transcriptase family protein [Candidatus Thiodiazotropha taylori]|nr:reverse transcriptase family protein [Candidatus Thiodiazotropha taylori]
MLNETDWNSILSTPDLNETVNKFTNAIIKSAKVAIPNKTVTIRPHEPKWISCDIKRQIRQRKRLFRTAKRLDNATTWTKFRQKRNAVTKLIREAKKKHNEKLASELKDTENSKSWFKLSAHLLNPNSDKHSIPYLETDNILAETNTEIAEVLNNYFTEQSTVDDSNATLPNHVIPSYPTLESIHISDQDVKDSISLLKVNKAPGPDLISPKLIKEGVDQLKAPLREIYNKSLHLQQFPDPWKDANVTPVYKKDSPTNPSNYRPISLLSCLGKLMERCIHKHISNYLKQNNIITPFQSGFQSGDSTINQLVYLNDTFLNALDKGKEVRIVFCDVSKAFDRVWHKGLLFKLKSVGFSGDILEWFSSYLSNRRQRVCFKGTSSSWVHINAGVPQGSILGPTLFLIFINDIVKNVRTNIRLFADDTSLFKIVDCPINAAIELNIDLKNIYNWAREWLVDFNATKTVSLIVSKKRTKPIHPELTMANSKIKEVNQHKHLGLIFSNDATWSNHIKVISEKAWKRIGYLRRLRFLLDRPSLQKIYTTFIRPLLEYGNIVWDNCTMENKRIVENIQLEAARLITGGTKLCSIQKLYDDTKWETLEKRRSKQKLYQIYKMINGLSPQYLQQLIPYRVMQVNRYPVRNSQNFSIPLSRTVFYSSSFLPSTLREWNALSQDTKNATSLSSFKYKLNNPKRYPPKYFENMQLSRVGQVLHARLRLECSSLKHHLYQKNLVDSPFCSCGQIESPTHFFLHCPNYIHQRQQYLSVLPFRLTASVLLNGIPSENVTVNDIIFKHVQLYIIATKRFQ